MRVTIIPDDDLVIVDGDPRRVDCSALRAAGVHAVQWRDTEGAIEWKRGPQEHIAELGEFSAYVEAHAARKAADLAAERAAREAAEEARRNAPPPRNLAAELDALAARVRALEAKP